MYCGLGKFFSILLFPNGKPENIRFRRGERFLLRHLPGRHNKVDVKYLADKAALGCLLTYSFFFPFYYFVFFFLISSFIFCNFKVRPNSCQVSSYSDIVVNIRTPFTCFSLFYLSFLLYSSFFLFFSFSRNFKQIYLTEQLILVVCYVYLSIYLSFQSFNGCIKVFFSVSSLTNKSLLFVKFKQMQSNIKLN